MDAPALTPNQLKQLRALADAEATKAGRAACAHELTYFNESAIGVVRAFGLVGIMSDHLTARGRRGPSWFLTSAGLERLKAEAAHG